MKKIKLVTATMMAFALSACLNTFNSDVTTFHQLPAAKGEKVSIVPIDPSKEKSLEFAAYAAQVGKQLTQLGYIPAKDAKPDLIVGLDYGINDGREKISTVPAVNSHLFWNRWYGFGYWHRYDPFFDDKFDNELRAKTVYKTTLNLEIRNPDGSKLYEGRAESETRDNSLPVLVPKLVEAIFINFPGESGKTTKVIVKPAE
ncbi:DUF4136 domain-containing protein [Temperatibacter marinus]|uniref:DUF4136 domain-containing protein n=1 Tax=Temperatibacter marinus TaxID=1456591 RepID=A0AA52EH98_9PROT|nr:DUF4136 domain-containing protein [Temperatibacter marinus]WND03643.1 DUF4136 domain-containing protein [Temperatibacter marinus]